MMIGGLPNFKEFEDKAKAIGAAEATDIDKLKAEVKWMKWAIILLVAYILYKETK